MNFWALFFKNEKLKTENQKRKIKDGKIQNEKLKMEN